MSDSLLLLARVPHELEAVVDMIPGGRCVIASELRARTGIMVVEEHRAPGTLNEGTPSYGQTRGAERCCEDTGSRCLVGFRVLGMRRF